MINCQLLDVFMEKPSAELKNRVPLLILELFPEFERLRIKRCCWEINNSSRVTEKALTACRSYKHWIGLAQPNVTLSLMVPHFRESFTALQSRSSDWIKPLLYNLIFRSSFLFFFLPLFIYFSSSSFSSNWC